MTTTATQERASRRGNGKRLGPILVSGCRLGAHFGISRQGVDGLVAQDVIERRPDGMFDMDQSRLRY
jgi:hypothetical protein